MEFIKKTFELFYRWGWVICILFGLAIVFFDSNNNFIEENIPAIKSFMCDIYFDQEVSCSLDENQDVLTSYLSVSIPIISSIYLFLLFIDLYCYVRNIISVKCWLPTPSTFYKFHSAQLLIPVFALVVFWGKAGLFYYDSILVAAAITFSIGLLYELFIFWIFLLLNFIVKRRTL